MEAVKRKPKKRNARRQRELDLGWQAYVEGGRSDDVLRNTLIEAEFAKLRRLAGKLNETLSYAVDYGELVSVGAMALIDAASRYDPAQGVRFWTFGARRALGAMMDLARDYDPLSRKLRRRVKCRQQFETKFYAEHGYKPSPEEIMQGLGWSREDWSASFAPDRYSLDASREDEEGALESLGYVLAACEDAPDGHAITESFLHEVCKGLPWDQQVMVYLYFVRDTPMRVIGLAFGLSESRISQQMKLARELLAKKLTRLNAA